MPATRQIGITGLGSYVPCWRLERQCVVDAMAWHTPGLAALGQGARSVCNHDEDALTMAVAASRAALRRRPPLADDDAVYLCSTTLPYEERLSSAILEAALGIEETVQCIDITHTRRAGILGLLAALDRAAARPGSTQLVVAADTPPGRPGSPEELLFGDGAAAVTVGSESVAARFMGAYTLTRDSLDRYRGRGSRFDYAWEDRFGSHTGYEALIPKVITGLLKQAALGIADIDSLVFPCPTPRGHAKLGRKLGCRPEQVADNLYETFGETGAAHPLLMLTSVLMNAAPGDRVVVCGFGSGASALLFEATDHIRALRQTAAVPVRRMAPYTRFLAYRGLLDPDTGIRGEKPQKTALSVLHRERETLLGLRGGLCESCGTPQFPAGPHCVNPSCRQPGPFAPYDFAHRTAEVKTYTGDYLVPSPAPPHIYGLIQFEGGGRMMAELTDCDLEEIAVGRKVTMTFRKRYADAERDFVGYFWKATPTPKKETP